MGDRLEQPKPKVVTVIEHHTDQPPAKQVSKKDSELIIFGESSDRIKYSLAQCCNPIPGDDVFGFVSSGKGLIIHRTNCPNAPQMMSNYEHRIVKTKWAKNKDISFMTGLKIAGLDDVGIINKITNVISGEMKINIAAMTIESSQGLFHGNIRVFVHDKEELEELLVLLKEIKGVNTINRYDPETEGNNT